MVESERWMPVKGYEGRYDVSDHGQVRSISRPGEGRGHVPARIIAKSNTESGYILVALWKNNKQFTAKVSRLVADAFCIKPAGATIVNHIDEVKNNDHYLNLEWTTPSGNTRHSIAKLTERMVKEIRLAPRTKGGNKKLAEKFGVSKWTVTNIRRTNSDKWVGV